MKRNSIKKIRKEQQYQKIRRKYHQDDEKIIASGNNGTKQHQKPKNDEALYISGKKPAWNYVVVIK